MRARGTRALWIALAIASTTITSVALRFIRPAAPATAAPASTALAPGALATPVGSAGQDREWRISSFHSEIEVFTSGDILVTETLRPTFDGSFNGIYRSIPVEYDTDRGFRYKLRLDVEAVEDENGSELRYETNRDGRYLKIKVWVPGAVNAIADAAVLPEAGSRTGSGSSTRATARSASPTTSCTGMSRGRSGRSRSIARRPRSDCRSTRRTSGRTRSRAPMARSPRRPTCSSRGRGSW